MKKTKTQKGITLVALVITIVVLLLLAVVALGAVRDSGIIIHAQDSSNKYEAGREEEELKLAVMEALLAGNGKFDSDNFEVPDGFVQNDDGTVTSSSGNTFNVNEDGTVTLIETETPDGEDPVTPPEGGDGEDPVTPPGTGEGGDDPSTTPTVGSDAWAAQGLEIAGQSNVEYNTEYANSTLVFPESDKPGLTLIINSDGGLSFNAFGDGAIPVDDAGVSYYKSQEVNRAYCESNFISFWCGAEEKYLGIKFEPNGIAQVYWEAPKNEDGTGPITSTEGLTPIGTISVAQ